MSDSPAVITRRRCKKLEPLRENKSIDRCEGTMQTTEPFLRIISSCIAVASLSLFMADVAAKMGLGTAFKPCVVRSDQGTAFVSHHFREFLSDRQIRQSLAATYTPQQNSHVERFWGSVFGTARVLLAAANLLASDVPSVRTADGRMALQPPTSRLAR